MVRNSRPDTCCLPPLTSAGLGLGRARRASEGATGLAAVATRRDGCIAAGLLQVVTMFYRSRGLVIRQIDMHLTANADLSVSILTVPFLVAVTIAVLA